MRKKESKNSYGVADDISFDNESENIDTQPDNLQTNSTEPRQRTTLINVTQRLQKLIPIDTTVNIILLSLVWVKKVV